MAVTYFETSTTSDLTGPSGTGGTSRSLVASRTAGGASADLASGNMNAGLFCNQNFFTPSGDPGTDGTSTGSFTVLVRCTAASAGGTVGIRVFLRRATGGDTGGTEVEASGGSQTAVASTTRTFTWSSPGLGTWASGDRLRIRVQLTNTSGTMNQSASIAVDTSDDTVATPFSAGSTDATPEPAVIAAIAALPQATPQGDATATPAAIAATVALPAATADGGGGGGAPEITVETTNAIGTGSGTTPLNLVLSSIEGNFQVVFLGGRNATMTPSINGDGWSTVVLVETEIADTGARRQLAMWWRVVPSGQSSTIQVNWSLSAAKATVGYELAATSGTWSKDNHAVTDNATTAGTSLASGSAAPANSAAITIYGLTTRNASPEAEDSYSNSFTTGPGAPGGSGSTGIANFAGHRIASGTNTTTASWSTSALATGIIAAFSVTGGGGGDATATPGVIAATTALPQSGVNVSSGPAQIAGTTALPQVGANVAAGPVAVAATAALPAANLNVSAGPSTIPLIASLPAPTILAGGNVTATPDTIATVAALLQPAINIGTGPAAITAVTVLPLAAVSIGATLTPAAIAAVVALPTATVITGGDAIAAPAAIAALLAMPAAAVNVLAGAAVIPIVVALPAASASAGSDGTTTPAVIAALAALPQPTIDGGTGVLPATIAATVAVLQSALFVSVAPSTIAVVVTFPATSGLGGLPDPNPIRLIYRQQTRLTHRETSVVVYREAQ